MLDLIGKEIDLVFEKKFRERCIERIDVLEKVKKTFLIPGTDVMTVKQVADYFNVGIEAIQSCYKEHKVEIDNDGAGIKSYKEFLVVPEKQLKTLKGKVIISFPDIILEVPNRGIKCFSKRAILRIAMLLRDSEIAKEIRTQLLNILEQTNAEQKTKDIDTEINFVNEIGRAYMTGDFNTFAVATQKYIAFQNRHIERIEKENEMLAGKVLEWTERASLNKAVRILSNKVNRSFGSIFNQLYDELRYKHGIGLSQRGGSPLIQHIREDEWSNVIQSFSAICKTNGCSASRILKRAKLQ